LAKLVFNPLDGTIRLNTARLVMQRANFASTLRDELVQALGPDQTRILLTRLGFKAGASDAAFVQDAWPNLDIGDAFTAGTRLHTVSGIVRVETVHNDFDFARKRFSGEFLWHDSVEATEHIAVHGPSHGPVCWAQLGYASGYASHFFNMLIVYKETQCAAAGHKYCRVIGKPADVWGATDPDVTLFRDHIVGRDTPLRPVAQPVKSGKMPGLTDLDALILSPVLPRLDVIAATPLPALICGPTGSGTARAAQYLAMRRQGAAPVHLSCAGLSAEALDQALTPSAKTARKVLAGCVILQDTEALPGPAQSRLLRHLAADQGQRSIVAVTRLTPAALRQTAGFDLGLFLRLSAYPIILPGLDDRGSEICAMAQACLDQVAIRCGAQPQTLTAPMIDLIRTTALPGNMAELENWLTHAVLISGAVTFESLQRARPVPEMPLDSAVPGWIADRLATGSLPLTQVEDHILQAALQKANGNLAAAARMIGLTRPQLAYRLERRPKA
jgi:hypothetical protein